MTKKKDPADRKKMGRPTKYTPELGQEIGVAIASSELGLIHLVNQHPHWPDRATIFKWITLHPDFGDIYARAKEAQTDVIVEYMQEVMSEPHKWVDEETGATKVDVPMLRLKMDTMKWHASKLKAKKYGEAKVIEPTNSDVDEDCKKRYREMDEKNKKDC